jgi:hypothetical protein
MFLSEATPTIYYGSEQALTSECQRENLQVGSESTVGSVYVACNDPQVGFNAQQTMWRNGGYNLGSLVPSIDALAYVGKSQGPNPFTQDTWRDDPFLGTETDMFVHIKQLNKLRRSCPPLLNGVQVYLDTQSPSFNAVSLVTYMRVLPESIALVIINPTASQVTIPRNFTLDAWTLSKVNIEPTNLKTEFGNIFDPSQKMKIHPSADSSLLIVPDQGSIPAGKVAVFMANDQIDVTKFQPELGAYLCGNDSSTPSTNQPTGFGTAAPSYPSSISPPTGAHTYVLGELVVGLVAILALLVLVMVRHHISATRKRSSHKSPFGVDENDDPTVHYDRRRRRRGRKNGLGGRGRGIGSRWSRRKRAGNPAASPSLEPVLEVSTFSSMSSSVVPRDGSIRLKDADDRLFDPHASTDNATANRYFIDL